MRRSLLLGALAVAPALVLANQAAGQAAAGQAAGGQAAAGQANVWPRAFRGAPGIVRPGPVQVPLQVTVAYSQQANGSKMSFALGHLPDPDMREVPGGAELVFESRGLRITDYHKLREITGIETRYDGERTLILIRFACNCQVQTSRSRDIFVVNVVNPTQSPQPKSPSAGLSASKFDAEQLRQTLTANLAALNATPPAGPAVPGRPGASASPVANQPVGDSASLAPAAPLAACPPAFDMAGWKGDDSFSHTLLALRHAAAATQEAAPEMAALAEFYLGNRLAGEAQDVARQGLSDDTSDADRTRLLRDADIAQLLRHTPIDASSSLLLNPPDCNRQDVPLWRALNAAAAHDTQGVIHEAKGARTALGFVPDELLRAFAYSIADASGEDVDTLRDMSGALRNAHAKMPEEEAEHYLLQARLSRGSGNVSEERGFLERAARYGRTMPGLIAKVRLAELASTEDGSKGLQSEALLADTARVYRDEALGQDAATYLAQRRLRQGDYPGALAIAEETAGQNGPNDKDSRGAALAARILRLLVADPPDSHLPDPAERIALYWRYGGYATPGPKGDDIRLGAARLMLAGNLASAALDVLRQLSPETALGPEAKAVRATAEARGGDPAVALLLVRDLSANSETHRIAADALERMGRPGEAAHQLDSNLDLADRSRRAALLCDAKAWGDAATAYADLLRDPALTGTSRSDAADRYSFAVALSVNNHDIPRPTVTEGLATRVLAAVPPSGSNVSAHAGTSIVSIRDALERARQIETLLPSRPPS
jgi:hypothetical protein